MLEGKQVCVCEGGCLHFRDVGGKEGTRGCLRGVCCGLFEGLEDDNGRIME